MSAAEPLALVGMACRFPGGANHPQAFWELLRAGRDAITEVPEERWNSARFYHPNSAAPGRMVTRWGGFIDHADGVDAAFFAMAPREAARIDPQQRWLMEVTWEAIEDAGLPPEQLAGTRTGVFIGISNHDYISLLRQDVHLVDGYVNIGSALCIAANRLSFLFNFRGPSFAVDTACSSSLVALHLAAQSLHAGDCDYAIVGAANELLTPQLSIGFSQAHMLSPNGRSRAFDAAADGYVRAEGAGAVLLMPLRTAQSLGLPPRALLLATASNQDGRSSSLAVPNQEAQEAMLRDALQSAGVRARDVVYVEAHGTGTPVGDPIEARAIAQVFGDGRGPNERLLIGSVKTNIGHLESASGIAGLIKAVLVLEQRSVPPHLHFETPNPQVPMDRVQVATALTPLPSNNGTAPLVAVNSFGFGGSNGHALLAPALFAQVEADNQAPDEPCIFPLSARSPAALAEYGRAYARFSERNPHVSLGELSAAVALCKSHQPVRTALVANSLPDLHRRLLDLGVVEAGSTPPKIAFVFSGQGPQWWAMGRELYEREELVRRIWHDCDEVCQKLGGPKLLDALLAKEADSQLNRTEIAQPALFALQAAIAELWQAWGIEADLVLGHSVGEAAAAWAAGIFDLEGIFRVILARSRWQAKTRGLGRMLAAGLAPNEWKKRAERFGERVVIAAINAPEQITLSGETRLLEAIATELNAEEIFGRFLPTEYAFHSPQMNSIEAGLRADLRYVSGRAAEVPMISTVTGKPVRGPELDADYWWRNVRQPVRFAAAIEKALRDGCTMFIEIGPHPVMASAIAEMVRAQKSPASSIASLRRGQNERQTMLEGLAKLYRKGANVRWDALYRRPRRALRLPAYPWQRQRLWHESPLVGRELRSGPPHPLLGDRQADPQPTWSNRLDARLLPWLADHRLAGSAVLPATAYIEMAAAAVREFLGESTVFLENIRFHHLLFLPEEQPVPVCLRLDPIASSFQISAAPPDAPAEWKLHAEGVFRPGRLHLPPATDMQALRERFTHERDPQTLYRELGEIGQVFGPGFQRLSSLRLEAGEALAEISGENERTSADYLLYPPALDCSFHPNAALYRQLGPDSRVIVDSVRQVRVFQPLPPNFSSLVRISERSENAFVSEIELRSDDGAVLAQVNGLTLRPIDSELNAQRERKFYQMTWEAVPSLPPIEAQSNEVLVFSDNDRLGADVAELLHTRQMRATFVFPNAEANHANGNGIIVDLRRDNWATELWRTLAARGPIPAQIVYLWSASEKCECATLLALLQARLAAASAEERARWLIVTRRAQAVGEASIVPGPAAVWGFARTIQSEEPHWNVSLVDVADDSLGESLLRELFASEAEPEVILRGDERWGRRLRSFQPQIRPSTSAPPAYSLEVVQTGRVDALEFRGCARRMPGPGEVEIEVAAAALNFRDLMKVLGIYPLREGEPAMFGDECSGRVVRLGRGVRKFKPGDRVMVMSREGGTFASHIVQPIESVWKIPDHLGFVAAASIPVVFGTAFHALVTLARLRRGETILIHAAAGGVGLAAVQLARQIGATVFATAGNEEKREYLRSLGVAQVMDSRTLDFADEILRLTNGRGVDVVLNSLAGAFQQKSLEVCAPHGRFVEIGKRDLFEKKGLPLTAFQRSLTFSTFDLLALRDAHDAQKRAVERFFSSGFEQGKIKPIRCTSFPARDAIAAFRLMQNAQHIGKIVLEFEAKNAPEVPAEFWPNPDATYLITGGLRGFGLATARWLAERGAMHLALVSRTGVASAKDARLIEDLRERGVSVATMSCDVSDAKALRATLRQLKKNAPPIRGVFHAAMVLRDRSLAEMTREDLDAVLTPKMTGAWNLHLQTRALPLDCFVMFSSLSALIGSPGQANYAAANAFLDALAQHRGALGLPGLSINWGQISDAGIVADRPEIGRYLESIGVRALSSKDALAALPRLIASGEAQLGVMNVDWDKLTVASSKFATSPVFRELVQAGKKNKALDHAADEWRANVRRLAPEEQLAAVSDLIVTQLAATFGMAAAEIDHARPLAQLGMDSLMAVELKARIESHAGCELPINLFSADLTAERLAERFCKQLIQSTHDQKVNVTARALPNVDDDSERTLRLEPTPLIERITAEQMQRLTAAALMPWPGVILEQLGLAPEAFFERMSGGRVSLDMVLETPLGSVGIFMLPMTAAQVNPGERSLLPRLLEGLRSASECGADCVALTGLIPSATNYGATVQAACEEAGDLPCITTGHATTVAAVGLNLEGILREAGREIRDETVMFYGIGSIGLSALQLMLDVLPHPRALHLCDPYRSAEFFAELRKTLRDEHGYVGEIRIVEGGADRDDEFYDARVIVGATNVEDVIDVARLAPGTLVVDDSWPHCMNGPAAFARFNAENDILFTEGGFVRTAQPMPRVSHVPAGAGVPEELSDILFSSVDPHDITACVLSALLSARHPELAPTIGLISPQVARQHWTALTEAGFGAAKLSYEGHALSRERIEAFRARFGRSRTATPLVPAAL